MAKFDPKAQKEKGSGNDNSGIPAGDYLLAMKNFQRKTSKAQKPYLRAKFEAIAGPAKGKGFFDSVSLDLENQGAMFRLSLLAEQCGMTEAFDLDDDGELRKALVGKPFKARVSRKVENGYTNNGIERYVVGDKISKAEREMMDTWALEEAERRNFDGDGDQGPDDVPPPSDDGYGGGYTSSGASPDDDIPF